MNFSIRKLFLCLLLAVVPGSLLFAQEDPQWAKQDVLSEPSRWSDFKAKFGELAI